MSSYNKTPTLRLNLWEGSDKPLREDFNRDNQILENVISTHIGDSDIHVTAAEKAAINAPFTLGSYIGTGHSTRAINLGFQPKLVIIFAHLHTACEYDSSGKMYSYSGFATTDYNSPGINITSTGFSVNQSIYNPLFENFYACMNVESTRYQYICFA